MTATAPPREPVPVGAPGTRVARLVGALGALIVALLAVLGVARSSGPSTRPLRDTPAGEVLLVSVPGLQWQDLEGVETPHLDALLGGRALLSVRTVQARTTTLDGYLTLGAGNRLALTDARDTVAGGEGTCIDVVPAATSAAEDQLSGAEPGALGQALADAGLTTAVRGGRSAIAALMNSQGCVGSAAIGGTSGAGDVAAAAESADVVLVELDGLADGGTAAQRADALGRIDAALAGVADDPERLVVVLAPSAPDEASEVTVLGIRTSTRVAPDGAAPTIDGLLSSGTTRRAGYATMADIAPTVLAALGVDLPESMNGTEIRLASGSAVRAGEGTLADLADRVAFRDRAVGPVSVVLVVLMSLCGLAALGRRARLARMLAPIVVAYPSITFLAGLVEAHHLPLDFVVVAVPVVSTAVAAVAVASWSRWGRWAPVGVLATGCWLVLVTDIVSGGRLQINTVLGYTPTIAGRFQGFGNLASGLVIASAIVVAVIPLLAREERVLEPRDRATTSFRFDVPRGVALGWAAWVGAVTLVVVAAPAFGSDVGGTLSLVPTLVLVALVLSGRRIGARRVLLAGAAGAAVVVALAAADLARPAASRTHLGRFADRLVSGEGGEVIERKLQGNLAILTSSFWSFVLLGILVLAGVAAWRWRARLATVTADRPSMRVFLVAFAATAVLGMLLNDSGIAVPGIMLAIGVPFLAVCALAPAARGRGE